MALSSTGWRRLAVLAGGYMLSCRLESANLPGSSGVAPPPEPAAPGGENEPSGRPPDAGGARAGESPPLPPPDAQDDAAAAPAPPDASIPIVAPDAALAPRYAVKDVTTWRGGAQAAYSIVHDGVCDSVTEGGFTHADPELSRRGLHGGFGAIVGSCAEGGERRWAQVKTLVAHGHDLVNHSWSHRCLGDQCGGQGAPSADYATEIDQPARVLQAMAGVAVQFFDFPFDTCGVAAQAYLKQHGYLGARCGGQGVTPPGFTDGFSAHFDTWGPSYSAYGTIGPCQGVVKPFANTPPDTLPAACRSFVLDRYVDDIVAAKGWGIRALTGFSDDMGAFQPIGLADYTAHLDAVKAKSDAHQLWVEGPTQVVRYRFARELCAAPQASPAGLHFGEPSAECRRHATTLSYTIETVDGSDPAALTATQGGAAAPTRKLAPGSFLVDADPTHGDVAIGP